MSPRTPATRHRPAGFALVETLVALLLLATGLVGAATTMIRGQAELRSTLLATRAADLAGNLAEQLRAAGSAPATDALLSAWQRTVGTGLAAVGAVAEAAAQGELDAVSDAGGLPASHAIRVIWWDPVLRAPRRLELPVLLSRAATE